MFLGNPLKHRQRHRTGFQSIAEMPHVEAIAGDCLGLPYARPGSMVDMVAARPPGRNAIALDLALRAPGAKPAVSA